jgi:hypothetical protein
VVKRMQVFLFMFLISAYFSACNETDTMKHLSASQQQEVVAMTPTAPTSLPTPSFPPYPKDDLDGINKQMPRVWEELQQKYAINVMASGIGQDHIMMQIRKYGDFEKPISSSELKLIRKTIFDVVGKEFPLKLDTMEFSQEGYMSGKIEKIEQDSVLIVNKLKKNGNTQDPQATWVSLSKDGKIYMEGIPEVQSFDKLAVGQQVHAWTFGVMLTSNPGHTSVLKIEILK